MPEPIYEATDDQGVVLTVSVSEAMVLLELAEDGVTLPPDVAREVAVALNLAVSEIVDASDG